MKFAVYSKVNSPQPEECYVWEFPGAPVKIHLSLEVVDRLGSEIDRAFKPVSRQAAEVGGILIGRALNDGSGVIEINDFEGVICESRNNNRYVLAGVDRRKLEKAIAKWKSGSGSSVLGFYRSHLRPDLGLDAEDLSLIRTYFSDPNDVCLLVKPRETGAPTAGFFFWQDTQIHSRFSLLEFPFGKERLSCGDKSPGLDAALDWVKATASSGIPRPAAPPPSRISPVVSMNKSAVPFLSNKVNGPAPSANAPSNSAMPAHAIPAVVPNGKVNASLSATHGGLATQPLPAAVPSQSKLFPAGVPARPADSVSPARSPAIVSNPIPPEPLNKTAATIVPNRLSPETPPAFQRPAPTGPAKIVSPIVPVKPPVGAPPNAPAEAIPLKPSPQPAPLKPPAQTAPLKPSPQPAPLKPAAQTAPLKPSPQPAPLKPAAQTAPLKPAAQAAPLKPQPAAAQVAAHPTPAKTPAGNRNSLFESEAEPETAAPVAAGWLDKIGKKRLGFGGAALIAIAGMVIAVQSHRLAGNAALSLKVVRTAEGYKVNWNPNTPLFTKAEGGLLSIRDGNFQKDLYLDAAQLHAGETSYPPSNNDVSFRLDVFGSGEKKNVSESVSIAAQAAPAGALPSPAAELPPLAQTNALNSAPQATIAGPTPTATVSGAPLLESEQAPANGQTPAVTAKPIFQPPAARPAPEATVKLEVPEPLTTPAMHVPAQPVITTAPIAAPPPVTPPASKVEQPAASSDNAAATAPAPKPVTQTVMPPRAAPPVAAALPPVKLPEQASPTYIPPRSISQVQPVVPANMKSLIHGDVQIDVRVSIDASGKVTGATPMSPKGQIGNYLGGLAANSARLWKFAPARIGNKNAPSEIVLRFRF